MFQFSSQKNDENMFLQSDTISDFSSPRFFHHSWLNNKMWNLSDFFFLLFATFSTICVVLRLIKLLKIIFSSAKWFIRFHKFDFFCLFFGFFGCGMSTCWISFGLTNLMRLSVVEMGFLWTLGPFFFFPFLVLLDVRENCEENLKIFGILTF